MSRYCCSYVDKNRDRRVIGIKMVVNQRVVVDWPEALETKIPPIELSFDLQTEIR